MWIVRLGWITMAAVGGGLVDDMIADLSSWPVAGVQLTAGVVWALVAAAVVVPTARSLTVVRTLAPVPLVAAVLTWVTGVSTSAVAAATAALAVVIVALVATGEFGRHNVQASAYGAEERFPLRAPVAYLTAAVLAWVLVVGGGSLTVMWIRSGHIVGAAIAGAVTLVLTALAAPRWHRLARRWLVLVPAGVVIHDPLVLAETVMLRRHDVAGVALATVDTAAADLSGPAGGHLLEIRMRAMVTAVLNAGPRTPGGRAIHLAAALVAPSRPGAALAAARRRGHPG